MFPEYSHLFIYVMIHDNPLQLKTRIQRMRHESNECDVHESKECDTNPTNAILFN